MGVSVRVVVWNAEVRGAIRVEGVGDVTGQGPMPQGLAAGAAWEVNGHLRISPSPSHLHCRLRAVQAPRLFRHDAAASGLDAQPRARLGPHPRGARLRRTGRRRPCTRGGGALAQASSPAVARAVSPAASPLAVASKPPSRRHRGQHGDSRRPPNGQHLCQPAGGGARRAECRRGRAPALPLAPHVRAAEQRAASAAADARLGRCCCCTGRVFGCCPGVRAGAAGPGARSMTATLPLLPSPFLSLLTDATMTRLAAPLPLSPASPPAAKSCFALPACLLLPFITCVVPCYCIVKLF